MPRRIRTIVGTVLVMTLIAAGAALAFLYSGVYPIGAATPHFKPVRQLLTTAQYRSVAYHARDVDVPPLHDPALVQDGFLNYRELCETCHGAPGVARERPGVGINPSPPPLEQAARWWSDAELYWITVHGIKLAGMPAFGLGEEATDAWAITAFIRLLPQISPVEYGRMIAAMDRQLPADSIDWLQVGGGWERLEPADPRRGRVLLDAYGCGACHVIPGVRGAAGTVGPPLSAWGKRLYIAGRVSNEPDWLIRWLLDPDAVEPGTAMPDVGATPEEARDMAAYLYTLD